MGSYALTEGTAQPAETGTQEGGNAGEEGPSQAGGEDANATERGVEDAANEVAAEEGAGGEGMCGPNKHVSK